MGIAELLPISEPARSETAIVFVHGFGGDAEQTWGRFPEFLRDEDKLAGWSLYSLGYASKLMPDLRGAWAGDPGIETLATYLHARSIQTPLQRYRRLALIAHSMGGLVVQKALVDFPDLVARVSHVLLYGTPSGGLKKAAGLLGRLFKRQTQDMGLDSAFIPALREAWRERFGDAETSPAHPAAHPADRPFGFWAVAGDRDEFVPAVSSLGPFAKRDSVVVPGNHLQIVKPDGPDSMSVQAAVDALVGDAAPGGPWNAARVAVEMGRFQEAIQRLEPHADDLDEPSAVQLALALEAVGRREDAVRVLETRTRKGGTDAMGTLAGRFKRVWWSRGTETPARKALDLYQGAYQQAVDDGEDAQAFYNGINVAFMRFAYQRDEAGAVEMATRVLGHCGRIEEPDFWCLATLGEAHFYLGHSDTALAAYKRAVAAEPDPSQMKSMFTQALRVAEALEDREVQSQLRRIFRRTTEEEDLYE